MPFVRVPVPRVVVPSMKLTLPVAAAEATVAVKVTEEPSITGFALEVRVVVVAVLVATTIGTLLTKLLLTVVPLQSVLLVYSVTSRRKLLVPGPRAGTLSVTVRGPVEPPAMEAQPLLTIVDNAPETAVTANLCEPESVFWTLTV